MRKTELTIFQKMLVAPLLGVLLYSAYLYYTHGEHKESSVTIAAIRDGYLPVLELVSENVILFDGIAGNLKDAVLAGEKEWVLNTRKEQQQIDSNLERLETLVPIVPRKDVEQLKNTFDKYYENAFALSLAMLDDDASAEKLNQLIENVEHFHSEATDQFEKLKADLQLSFSQQIDETNQRLNQLVLVGVGMGVVLTLLIVSVTFAMSLSTRRSLGEVNRALKNIAQDKPDFSRRLDIQSDDELGELVSWFNLLSEKLEKDYKKIEQLSMTDKLTQLYNRTKIDELFEMELNKAKRYREALSVILLDLDHFKAVNDNYGHLVGDAVLKELAKILRSNVRKVDHLGRWGGEEFIILSPNTTLEQAQQQAEKLRLAIAEYDFTAVKHKTGSFGVASYHEGDNEDTITKRADDALYLAKERGRNRVVDEAAL